VNTINHRRGKKNNQWERPPRFDLLGKRFGKLTVVEFITIRKRRGKTNKETNLRCWKCRCDCGKTISTAGYFLRNGQTVSCGCYNSGEKNKRRISPADSKSRKGVYSSYKWSALKRGFVFELGFDDFIALTQMECFYCGDPPRQIKKSSNGCGIDFIYNGVDRLDSRFGYTPQNVVPCCGKCNFAKGKSTKNEFLNLCHKISKNHPIDAQ